MQLDVIDCNPALKGRELRRFARAVFHTCIAEPVGHRLTTALEQLGALGSLITDQAAQPVILAALNNAKREVARAHGRLGSDDPAPRRRARRRRPQLRGPVVSWGWQRQAEAPSGKILSRA